MAEKKVSQKVACSVVKTAGLSEKNSADLTVAPMVALKGPQMADLWARTKVEYLAMQTADWMAVWWVNSMAGRSGQKLAEHWAA